MKLLELPDLLITILHSWAYWQYKYFDDFTTAASPGYVEGFYQPNGQLYENKVKALSRSYAPATCGTPESMIFNPDNAEFKFAYKVRLNCGEFGTELYLSKQFYYPKGFKVSFKNCDNCELKQLTESDPNYFKVVLTEKVKEGTVVKIKVERK